MEHELRLPLEDADVPVEVTDFQPLTYENVYSLPVVNLRPRRIAAEVREVRLRPELDRPRDQ